MKKTILLCVAVLLAMSSSFAQTADEVIEKYLTAVGGKEKLAAIKTVKMTGKGKQQGMEFPLIMHQKAPNKQKQTINFQGKEIVISSFDGKEMWTTNFMNMKPEKSEAEDSENAALDEDIPDLFYEYQKKGYKIELEGEESIEGTDCYRIKLTKKPIKVDGKTEENVSQYYFDKENGVMILMKMTGKKGPSKGVTIDSYFSDYQEVNGLVMPYTISQKVNGQEVFSINIEKIEFNVAIDDKEFGFPN
jgi:outer membrane lipoprotein-sorting protein